MIMYVLAICIIKICIYLATHPVGTTVMLSTLLFPDSKTDVQPTFNTMEFVVPILSS